MALSKDDLKQIKIVVHEEVVGTEKRLTKKTADEISGSEKRLTKKIEDEVGNLAAMTAREFSRVHKKLENHDKQFEVIKKTQLEQEFNVAGLVHKSDFLTLKERVTKLGLNSK